MVVRRIREHVITHNWFAVGVDVLIVIVGVFVGTQANNWNDARRERQQGLNYREQIIDDLRSNERDMQQRQVYYGSVRDHAVAALQAFDRPSAQPGENFLIDAYQATQISPDATKRFTYDETLATGAFHTVGNKALRERIANYYIGVGTVGAVTSDVPPYRERLRRIMPYAVQQRIRARCSERLVEDSSGATKPVLPKTCALGFDGQTIADAVAQVRNAPELKNDLTRYVADLDTKLALFKDVERRASRLRVLMSQ